MRRAKGQALENGNREDTGHFVRIPHNQLSPETLTAVIEEYVTRAGTDYGETEIPFEQQVLRVKRYLEAGKAFIAFNKESGTCSIVLTDNFKKTGPIK